MPVEAVNDIEMHQSLVDQSKETTASLLYASMCREEARGVCEWLS